MPIAVSDIDRFRFIHCRATDLLTDEQVSALGIVAAEFGRLEAALNSHGQRLFMLRIPFTQMTGNAGATRHSELLLDAVGRYCDGVPDIVAHITKYLRDVPGLAVRRNEYVHAAWGTVF